MVSPNIEKVGKPENILLALAGFATLMPPAFQGVTMGLLLLRLIGTRAWQEYPFTPEGRTILRPLLRGVLILLLLTLISLVAGIVVHGDDALGTLWAGAHLLAKQGVYGPLMIFFLFASRRRGWDPGAVLNPWIWFLVALFLYCLVQRYTGLDLVHGWGAVLPPNRFDFGVYRVSGFMGHPLSLGYNAVMVCLVSWTLALASARGSVLRRKWSILFVLSFLILVLSSSRWPLAVLAIVLCADTVRRFRNPLILVPVVLLLAGAVFSSANLKGRFADFVNSDRKIEERLPRVVFWKVHTTMVADHPWVGIGYGNRNSALLDYYSRSGYTNYERKYSAHNIYLQTLADSGVIGFGGLIAFLTGCWIFARRFDRSGDHGGMRAFMAAALLAGLMQNTLRDSEYLYAFWFLQAFSLSWSWPVKDQANGTQ